MWAYILLLLSEPAVAAADVEFVPRLWEPPASFPETLRDVASRLPPGTEAKDADLVTYAHEGTHFLCRGNGQFHGLYLGNGLRVFVKHPPIRTVDVFDSVPESQRDATWRTYRNQAATEYWRDRPLMILDEWNAYRMGCLARRELGLESRAETIRHCGTFAELAVRLHNMASHCEGYPMTDLTDYCRLHLDLCRQAVPAWDQQFSISFD